MKRALVFLLLGFLLETTACSQKLGNDGPPPPPPGHARLAIKQNGTVKVTTRFDNLSAWDYFYCKKVDNLFSIKARRFMNVPGKKDEVREFTFFFPDSEEINKGVQVSWSGSEIMVAGKVTDKSLGGPAGRCLATLHRTENVLMGDISCSNFVNPDDNGFGQYDFDVLDFLCTVI